MKNTNSCGLGACAIIGSLVWATGTVSAQEASAQQDPAASEPAPVVASKSFRLALENSATLAGGLSVQLNKTFLREGDALVVTVDVPRDGYLYLVSVGPDDVATVLFPNQSQRDHQVPVGQVDDSQRADEVRSQGHQAPWRDGRRRLPQQGSIGRLRKRWR